MEASELPQPILSIIKLPAVVITHIFSFLSWREKINVVHGCPDVLLYLQTSQAWPCVKYCGEGEENIYFARESRTKLLICLKQFGRFMRAVELSFAFKVGRTGIQLMLATADHCPILKHFRIVQELNYGRDDTYVWKRNIVHGFCKVLQKCKRLNRVELVQPIIEWPDEGENNVLCQVFREGLCHKLTELHLGNDSLLDHEGYLSLDIIKSLTGLEKLFIKRDKVNDEIIRILANNRLTELSLFQDEELSYDDNQQLRANLWKDILTISPTFKIDLIQKYIMVIKDSFPINMPLRKLILDDLVNIITKGVVDHLVTCYKDTLEAFTYTNSFIETFEMGDRRLPFALADMAEKCTKLTSIQHGFPISSTSVLVIASMRKLKCFVILEAEIFYDFDWTPKDNWSPEFIDFLKENCKSEQTLETSVSEILGYEWHLCHDFSGLEEQLTYLSII